MKAVLISIQPKWCELIASGKKTVEVRKTKPKLETPFKVYIYCTYGEGLIDASDEFLPNHLIGRNVSKGKTWENCCNGKVIGEFVCDCIMEYCPYEIVSGVSEASYEELPRLTQLSREELLEYCGNGTIYTWHISDLVIYDKPKELSEFFKACDKPSGTDCSECVDARSQSCKSLTRPPQSWCYVEGVTNERTDKY